MTLSALHARLTFAVHCGALAILLLSLGCNRVPEGRSAVNEVQVRGADKIDDGDVEDKIATTETKKFLGLFRGVLYDYSVFDRFVLQRDLARVEAFYRSKGYYNAHARAGRVHQIDDKHVRVEILVEEGEPILVRGVRVEGLDGLPPEIVRAAEEAAKSLADGKPFEEEIYERTGGDVRRALTNRGYAYATVKNDAAVDIVRGVADVVYRVRPGPVCKLGPVKIEGLGSLPDAPIRRAADLAEGERYSEAELDGAQQAILDLGVFAAVDVVPDLGPEKKDGEELSDEELRQRPTLIPVLIKVEPSRLRTVRLGVGVEFDAIKSDVHGLVGWENRNFLGGMRSFSVNFRPGIVFYPLRATNIELPNKFLPEERLRLELRQPGFPEARTNAFIRPEFNVQALLLSPDPPPNQPVIGYAEARNAIGLDRTYWKLFGAISHNLQAAYPFAYVGPRDPTLGPLLISYPELFTELDFTNDKVHPRRGIRLGNTLQVAGHIFGGMADDVKVQPDLRGYIPITKRVVFASRASVGFLLPRNYGHVVRDPRSVFERSEERTRDYQLTFFRGFFSGGPTGNRGYPLRGVSPHDIVPFISPEFEEQRLNVACGPGSGFDCRTPTGGFTLWEASAELRISVSGPLSVATFCDASDVSPRTADIRLDHLHLSCGAGGRYDTPVGPVRLDLGYRLPGLQVLGGLTPDERGPPRILGIPIAIHFGIGEAY